MRNKKLLMLVILTLLCTGCVSFARIDGPYEGRVIDADTKEPVEGAVVHGSWYKVWGTVGGASSEWYDSAETLTDKDGAFRIRGKGLLLLSNIDEMDLTIFKAGYKQWTPNPWSGLKGKWPNDEVTWEGNKPTFRLKRLSMKERKARVMEMPGAPANKTKLLRLESNRENREIGRPDYTLYPED